MEEPIWGPICFHAAVNIREDIKIILEEIYCEYKDWIKITCFRGFEVIFLAVLGYYVQVTDHDFISNNSS